MRTTDNNGGKLLIDIEGCDNSKTTIENLSAIANKKLSELQKENPDLLVFPQELDIYHDDIGKLHICSLHDDKLTTYNLMGFIGRNNTQLTISSRFIINTKNNCDYFLYYMLGKVLSLNIVNLDTTKKNEGIEDFLPYLFPAFLKKALSQGIYKEYHRNEYNNTNVRGVIDIPRNIRLNLPFMGNFAYNTREYCYDNFMTELIRHTIEHLRTLPMTMAILTASTDTRSYVQQIIDCTRSYNKNDRRKIINANLKPFHHPYYTNYLPLQRLCLQILKYEKVSFGTDKDKIHGLLFDGAWLWEEYLNSILKNDFSHPCNKTKGGMEYLFTDSAGKGKQEIYPDFINKEKNIIADAKYKHLEYNNEEYGREDYFQIITYMYRFNAKYGFLLFPHSENIFYNQYSIIETEGHLSKIGLAIPQQSESYETFCKNIIENENTFLSKLKECCQLNK
jgi:5-methylcytosine-specific restriction endonuclease McrBC regulatory subunit McrC